MKDSCGEAFYLHALFIEPSEDERDLLPEGTLLIFDNDQSNMSVNVYRSGIS